MSNKVQFKIYSGDWADVIHDQNGVNLSKLKSARATIDRPLEKSFASILNWLARGLNVNRETQVLTVQTLTNWDVEGDQWDLMLIQNTEDWHSYMNAALDRGWTPVMYVQIHNKAQVAGGGGEEEVEGSDPVHEEEADRVGHGVEEDDEPVGHGTKPEPQGVADEVERIPRIIEEMEEEDREAQEMEEAGDSSDEEEARLPAELAECGFGAPVIEGLKHQEWEYRANEVV